MKIFSRQRIGAAVLMSFLAQSAAADLSASDVWTDWRDYMTGLGTDLQFDETDLGSTLRITGLTATLAMPEEQGSMIVQLGDLVFQEQGDGTVAINVPQRMPMTTNIATADGQKLDYEIEFVQSGMNMIASGTPVAMNYAYTADSVAVVMQAMMVDGEPVAAEDASFNATLRGLNGKTDMIIAAMRSYSQTISADTMSVAFQATPPEDQGGKVDFSAETAQMVFTGTGAIPLAVLQASDMQSMIDAGFAVEGGFEFASGQTSLVTQDPNGPVSIATSSQGGRLDVKMSQDGLSYAVSQEQVNLNASIPGLPFPLTFAMQSSSANLAMPLKKSDEPGDFAFGFALNDFTMADALWNLFDTQQAVPRDPATAIVSLKGKARLLFDFLDPAAAAVSGNPNITPAEVEQVTIEDITLKAAGAELTGSGGFDVENTPGAAPKPVGAVSLRLRGGNTLIDTLVAAGLLPQEQAMGARMMLGLFATPAPGEDTLVSEIEVNEDGHILANGQRIQ